MSSEIVDTYELNPHDVVALLESFADSRESFTVVTSSNNLVTYVPIDQVE